MNKTQVKILECALKMYNEQGIDSITVRHIAKELDIRHSNITYYYPKKDDIIEVLYHQMQREVDQVVSNIASSANVGFDLAVFEDTFDVLYKYRFVHINSGEIFKRLPELKEIYLKNRVKRNSIYLEIANNLKKTNILDSSVGDEFIEIFLQNVTLINDFWVVFCDINPVWKFKEQKAKYLKLILSAFLPYLTEKGINDFKKMILAL